MVAPEEEARLPEVTPSEEQACATGGIHIGGGDRLARAGCAGGGRWTTRGGLVVEGGHSPGGGRVGAGGQEVVLVEKEEAAAF